MTQPTDSNQTKALREAGVSLPINATTANAAAASMINDIKDGSAAEAIKKQAKKIAKNVSDKPDITVESERRKRMTRTGSVSIAIDKKREPFGILKSKGIPYSVGEDPEERKKAREWCRGFYATHNLQSTAVDIFAKFPVQGLEITSKDPEIAKFYETLFFDQLNYETWLEDFGREYWTIGEVNSLANWNETLGIWDDEQILNPDDMFILPKSLFGTKDQYYMQVPEAIKEIVRTGQPAWEYKMLKETWPDIFEAAQFSGDSGNVKGLNIDQYYQDSGQFGTLKDKGLLSISEHVLSRTINNITPWDVYGTPHMMRAFSTLMMEESLNAAQDAVADRLYSPMILAKLGTQGDIGDNQGPWIPSEEDIEKFTGMMQAAFASDFRFLAYHYGIDIKSVFGRESLPNFDRDYDRLERKMLQVWGIGEGLISGSSNGSYASSALNREFVTQLMTSYQKRLKLHFRKRCEIVAEAQEHFDYESSGGIRTPIYEEILETDPDTGEQYITKRPKLLLPELKFKVLNLRDETQERSFLDTLKKNGVPISDSAFMTNIDVDFKEELEKIKQEKMQKIIAEQEMKVDTYLGLKARGLPIPAELASEVEPTLDNADPDSLEHDDGLPGEQGRPDNGTFQEQGRPDPEGDMQDANNLPGKQGRPEPGNNNLPGKAGRPQSLPGAQGRPSAGGSMPGTRGRPKQASEEYDNEPGVNPAEEDREELENEESSSQNAISDITAPVEFGDITDPIATPNLAPNDEAAEEEGEGGGEEGGFKSLPRNEISQRPEISDEQRKNAPRKAMRYGPSTLNARNRLNSSSVKDAIDSRNWVRSITQKPEVD